MNVYGSFPPLVSGMSTMDAFEFESSLDQTFKIIIDYLKEMSITPHSSKEFRFGLQQDQNSKCFLFAHHI
jgi:hypothetical protein